MKKKKLLILGGSSDIGEYLAKELLKLNVYNIHIHCNSNSRLLKNNNNIKLIKADFTLIKEKEISKKFDKNYDIVINLVGYISNSSFTHFNEKEFYKTIRANSLIPILIIRNSLKHMIQNNFGRILNSSSIGVKFGGGEQTYLYSLSKHINEFIPNYLKKISKNNIIYNCLRIGVVNTKLHKKIANKNLNKRKKLIPLNKIAEKKDISDLIIHLIEKNNFLNNEVINITGGE